MKRYDISLPCDRPDRTGRPATCLQLLAEGFTGSVRDLCPGCTRRMMAGLDIISDQPLTWHAGYTARATTTEGNTPS